MVTDMVSIPITLEQPITAVQQLQPDERAQVARALNQRYEPTGQAPAGISPQGAGNEPKEIQTDLRSDLTALIQELQAQPPANEITDDDIRAEIKAVRQQSQQVWRCEWSSLE
jgi:hypothetical protein